MAEQARNPNPLALTSTLERDARHVTRQMAEVNALIVDEVPADPEVGRPQLRNLNIQIQMLRQERADLETHLVAIEQATHGTEAVAVLHNRETWGDLLHDSLRTLTRAEALSTEMRERYEAPQQPRNDGAAAAAAENPQNFGRFLDILEQRLPAQPVAQPVPAQNPGPSSRLPKLELPKFDGDPLKWRPFWDRFTASIHNNEKINAVDKMNYLLSLLEGEALTLVETLSITAEHYQTATQTLLKRFGNEQLLKARLYRTLNEMKSVSNQLADLRKFAAEIDCLMGSLGALGQNTTDDNFVTIILSKLPESVVMILEISKEVETEWTVALVREKLQNYLTRMERSSTVSAGKGGKGGTGFTTDSLFAAGATKSKAQKKPPPQAQPPQKPPFSKKTPLTDKSANPVKRCAFCANAHWSDQCRTYPDYDSRRQKLESERRCYICLGTGHLAKYCNRKKPCFYCSGENHHSSLCRQRFGNFRKEGAAVGAERHADHYGAYNRKEGAAVGAETYADTVAEIPVGDTGLLAMGQEVLLQTATVLVSNGKRGSKQKAVRALLDSGTNRTYLEQQEASDIGLEMSPGPHLSVNRFGSDKPTEVPTKVAKVTLQLADGSTKTIDVSVIPKVTGNLTRAPVKTDRLKNLSKTITLADSIPYRRESGPIPLIIGSDYYLEIVTGEWMEIQDGLFLLGSRLGWILSGRTPETRADRQHVSFCGFTNGSSEIIGELNATPYDNVEPKGMPNMEDLSSVETLGIQAEQKSEDHAAETSFKESVKFRNSRYSVSLPWNDRKEDLLPNYETSLGRLRSLLRRLKDNPEATRQYNEVLDYQLRTGIIEKVGPPKAPMRIATHYLPHHAVIKPERETTKVRVVFDGASKANTNHPSLNQCLMRGPILLEDLAGILLRFRLNPVALVSDIEKAFLQIGINEEDRDYLRFLWIKDTTRQYAPDQLQEFRFARVVFGLNCSPSLLAQTIRHHLEMESTDIAKQIWRDIYVDNVITGTSGSEKAKSFYADAKAMFAKASMNLREWACNNGSVISVIPEKDRCKSTQVKVLGLEWNTANDCLSIKAPDLSRFSQAKTKREVLTCVSSIFDPLGFLVPCTIKSKQILQKICADKADWDTPIKDELRMEIANQGEMLKGINQVVIPRFVSSQGWVSIVCFCDASTTNFATAIYLKSSNGHQVQINLIWSKSRLAPLKGMTVPRLELMAVLIGTRAVKFVSNQLKLPVKQKVICSDSKVALCWIRNGKDDNKFLRNRISEIRKSKDVLFRHVPTDENPADLCTRGKKLTDLNEFWWHGPGWLLGEKWPPSDPEPFKPADLIEQSSGPPEISFAATETAEPPPFGIQVSKYSSLIRLVRITAWALRFVSRIRKDELRHTGELSAVELHGAKIAWEKYVQSGSYRDVIEAVALNKKHKMSNLGVFADENGLLRCKGRMVHSALPLATKLPKLLPKNHIFTSLVIQSAHRRCRHGNPKHTLNTLRQEYWIPRGLSVVQAHVSKCVICRKAIAKPFGFPPMPEYPKSRVCPYPCFANSGVDYFGPMKVLIRGVTEKCWVALFTCLGTRAVHLELVLDMSASEFLLALRRFISRRGHPTTMLSDNAPQFKLVARTTNAAWQKSIKDPTIANFAAENGIQWTYIPEFAPYAGGIYETMVGIVKESLRKTVGRALLSLKQLETVLAESEAIVNSRPLVNLDSEPNEGIALTPAHFLSLNPHLGPRMFGKEVPNNFLQGQGIAAETLLSQWKKGQNLLNEFWKIWSTEYLNMLREKSKYAHRGIQKGKTRLPYVGQLVLLKETGVPRGAWRMAKITELIKGVDEEIRSVKIKKPTGQELRRPVTLLIPLEIEILEKETVEDDLD